MGRLAELGFTINEEKIYLTLIKKGGGYAGEVAERAGVHRRNAYDVLTKLVQKGVLSAVFKGGRKFYTPLHPKKLYTLEKERVAKWEEELPALEKLFEESKEQQQVVTLEGEEGVKNFLVEFAEFKGKKYVIGSSGISSKRFSSFFPQVVRRFSDKYPVKILWVRDIERSSIYKRIPSTSRTLPGTYHSPAPMFIYGNNVAIVVWSALPVVVVITNENVRKNFVKYFNILWKSSS